MLEKTDARSQAARSEGAGVTGGRAGPGRGAGDGDALGGAPVGVDGQGRAGVTGPDQDDG